MRTQIKLHLKRLISLYIAFVLLFSAVGTAETVAYAVENDFAEVTLSLNSNVVDNASIDLYVKDSMYFITIDDLCKLTRCSKTVEGNTISVKQGIWSAKFEVTEQVFSDDYQTVDVAILEVSENEYAVPALMFLSYYNAMALIENDTLYCRMSECTAWEALDVDYGNSLVDIYELYGSEGNVVLSLTLDIIMDFIVGEAPTSDGYLTDAYNATLNVDMYSYEIIQDYVESNTDCLYTDLVSEKTAEFLGVISSKQEYNDSNEKVALEISQSALELYIDYATQNQISEFYNLAFDVLESGDESTMVRYADQIAAVWKDGEVQKILAENKIKTVEGTLFLLSSAMEASQQIKYANQANNLVYRVMGQENLNKLNLDASSNEWFEVANVYKSTSAALQDSFVSTLKELQRETVNDLVSEAAKEIGINNIAGVKTGVWKIGLESGRIAVKFFSWMDSLVSDTWLDYMWTDVGAYEADRLALYLSELQQNVYWVTCNELNRLSNNLSDPDAYGDYIYAQQLYCRTSIAMYENLMYMVDELGKNRDYWLSLFQDRIDMLAVSLYQLTTLQDDGVNACLPLELASFTNPTNTDNSESSAYDNVLDMYYESISCNWTNCNGNGWDNVGDPDNACYILSRYEAERSLSEVGYCLLDINDDGRSELIISLLNEPGLEAFPELYTGTFYDLYTIVNGEIIHAVSAGERDRYNLAVDYTINNHGSGDAVLSSDVNYRLDGADGTLKVNQVVIYDGWRDSENPYFYATTDYYDEETYDFNYEVLKPISNDEASVLLDSFPKNIMLELIPFDEYTPDSSPSMSEDNLQGYLEMLSQALYVQYVQENSYNYEYTVKNDEMVYNFALVDINQDGRQELIVDAMDLLGWFADLVFTQNANGSVNFLGSLWTYSPVEYSAKHSALSYILARPAFGEVPYAYVKLSDTGIIDYSIEEYDDSFEQLDWMTMDEMLSYLQSISVED